jgi:cytochrome c oxidase subunit 1
MATEAIARPHEAPAYGGILEWITTTDHKKIGIMYLFFTVAFFVVGGILALLVALAGLV